MLSGYIFCPSTLKEICQHVPAPLFARKKRCRKHELLPRTKKPIEKWANGKPPRKTRARGPSTPVENFGVVLSVFTQKSSILYVKIEWTQNKVCKADITPWSFNCKPMSSLKGNYNARSSKYTLLSAHNWWLIVEWNIRISEVVV